MIPRKLVETLFRRLWLLAIPVVVVPLLATLLADFPVEYRSSARIWVSPLEGVGVSDTRPKTPSDKTASESQVEILTDLLATDAFRAEVAQAANLLAPGADEATQSAALSKVERAVTVASLGPNLFGLTATSPNAAEAQAIAKAVIDRYQERIRSDAERQSDVVIDYYRTQVSVATRELENLQGDLAAYLVAHPPALDPWGLDTERPRLQGRVDAQQAVVDELNTALRNAERDAASAPNSQLAVFNVQDAPKLPAAPVAVPLSKRAMYPVAGFVVGAFISAAYLYFCYRTDHSIRSREDLAELPIALLGYVPELKPSRRSRLAKLVPFRRRQPLTSRIADLSPSITTVSDRQGGLS